MQGYLASHLSMSITSCFPHLPVSLAFIFLVTSFQLISNLIDFSTSPYIPVYALYLFFNFGYINANITQNPLYKSHSGYGQLTRIASIYILHVSLIYGFTMAMVMRCLGNMLMCFLYLKIRNTNRFHNHSSVSRQS